MKKIIFAICLVFLSFNAYPYGSGGGGTGAQPISNAQKILRAGYEVCKQNATSRDAFDTCMADVYAQVKKENGKPL